MVDCQKSREDADFWKPTVWRCRRRPVRRAQVYDGEQMVWIQRDEVHNQFKWGPNLRGHDYEAIGAGQKAEFGMMMENGVLSIQGTGASIVSISSSESFKLLLQLCHPSVKPPFATQPKKKVTAPHIPLAIHACVSTRIITLQTITCNHLDAHLWPRTQSTKTASYILVRFPNSEDPSSAVGLLLSTAYTFVPFIRCFSVSLACLGTDIMFSNYLPALFCVANSTRHQR